MSFNSNDTEHMVHSTDELLSSDAFKGIIWGGLVLCAISFSARAYIRFVCFRKLVLEDYLTFTSLALILASSVICQLYIDDVYDLMAIANRVMMPGPNYIEDTRRALYGTLLQIVFGTVCLWTVKFNFLLFFYRLIHNVHGFKIFWWIVTVTTAACGVVTLGLVRYDCLVGSNERVFFGYCYTASAFRLEYTAAIVSCVVDVFSDILIMCFPISVLWKIRVSFRKKLILSAIFSVVAFTIAVSIIRGSIFGGVYKSIDYNDMQSMNITWIWFWLSVECIVSFIASCVVSFRSLFAHRDRERSAKALQERQMLQKNTSHSRPSWLQEKVKAVHDSLLTTCLAMEGASSYLEMSVLPHPVLDRMSLDLSQENLWAQNSKTLNSHTETEVGHSSLIEDEGRH